MLCADTSFLISLYGTDANTSVAKQHWAINNLPIHIHVINDFEFRNALRALVFRGKIESRHRQAWITNYQMDKIAGLLVASSVDANAVLVEAEIMSAAHAEQDGHRAYDILHIAAAKLLGATEFWSFDGKQRALAAAEGMTVGP